MIELFARSFQLIKIPIFECCWHRHFHCLLNSLFHKFYWLKLSIRQLICEQKRVIDKEVLLKEKDISCDNFFQMLIDSIYLQIFSIAPLEIEEVKIFAVSLAGNDTVSPTTMGAPLQIKFILKHLFICQHHCILHQAKSDGWRALALDCEDSKYFWD